MFTNILKKEPSVLIGIALAALTAVAQALADNPDATTWLAVIPLAASAIIRQFVVSPATSERREAAALEEGKEIAVAEATEKRAEAARKGAANRSATIKPTTKKTTKK